MKKTVALLLCVMLFCALLCGCGAKTKVLKETDEFIVITPSEDFVGKTLKDCMDDLKTRGELEFTEKDSEWGAYIDSVNGIASAGSKYWLLYTDDTENSGGVSIKCEEKTCYLASYGASNLIIAKGCIYVWVYGESPF